MMNKEMPSNIKTLFLVICCSSFAKSLSMSTLLCFYCFCYFCNVMVYSLSAFKAVFICSSISLSFSPFTIKGTICM
jgi:hypothetical protein